MSDDRVRAGPKRAEIVVGDVTRHADPTSASTEDGDMVGIERRRAPHCRAAIKPRVSLKHQSCIPRSSLVMVTWSVFELSVSVAVVAATMLGISPSPSSIRSSAGGTEIRDDAFVRPADR